jgi:hypothetical protein
MTKIIITILALVTMSVMLVAQQAEQNNPPMDHSTHMRSQQNNPQMAPQHSPMHHQMRLQRQRPGMNQMMGECSEMNLNEEQKTRMTELRNRFQQAKNTFHAEIQNLKIDLKAALAQDNFDQAKTIVRQMGSKRTQFEEARISHMQAVMGLLDAEQKVMARRMFEMRDRQDRMGSRRNHQGGQDCQMMQGGMRQHRGMQGGQGCQMMQGGMRQHRGMQGGQGCQMEQGHMGQGQRMQDGQPYCEDHQPRQQQRSRAPQHR